MIDLKKVMKGLRIEIDKYNAKISGNNWVRPNIEYIAKNKHADYDYGTLQVIGARVILAAMDEYEEPKLDPDSDCPHGHFVHACSICTKPAEPKPAWEPGTVLKTEDWFECDYCNGSGHGHGPLKVTRIAVNGWIYGHAPYDGISHDPAHCRHVPAPKEAPRKEAVADLAGQKMADGHYVCEEASSRFREVLDEASKRVQEWPDWKKSEALKLSVPSPKLDRKEDPFQGEHWDNLDFQIAELEQYGVGVSVSVKYYELLRQRDLRDEMRRLRENK